jgi:hypothetical protein
VVQQQWMLLLSLLPRRQRLQVLLQAIPTAWERALQQLHLLYWWMSSSVACSTCTVQMLISLMRHCTAW